MGTRLPAEQRRKQIVAAAVNVFARHGYRGATTRAIAAEAGVAEALLYKYFSSKEALFIAAVERTAGRILEGTRSIVARHPEAPHVALGEMLGFVRGLLDRNETLAKMVFIVNAELDEPAIRDAYVPFQDQILELFERALTSWQDRGLLPNEVPARATAWLVLGTFEVLALMKLSGRLHELDASPVELLVQRMLGGEGTAPNSE